ncbi:MAG: transketolase [Phycisphaeraceae bacterium]|nr:transketolase [Phycisphaeraceae bacterium]
MLPDNTMKTMRDSVIDQIYAEMQHNDNIFFLSADFGAPALDQIRKEYADRFVNVGIAEQNLINVATGLALEGYCVYAYAIAGFITMRAFEQVRTNLALMSQERDLNVTLIGVGAGVSYDMSGPSHHCLEDISIMRTLPNMVVCSPSDWGMARAFIPYSIKCKGPKYLRLDSKPVPCLYSEGREFDWEAGFYQVETGKDVCIITTGVTTRHAVEILRDEGDPLSNVGLIDVFMLNSCDNHELVNCLKQYKKVVTLEEGFKGKGGLDSLIANLIVQNNLSVEMTGLGFEPQYAFSSETRSSLYGKNGMSKQHILAAIKR